MVRRAKTGRWTHIRVPVELAARIDQLRTTLQTAYVTGRIQVPDAFCERIPAWYTIQHALDEQEARRQRSRKSKVIPKERHA